MFSNSYAKQFTVQGNYATDTYNSQSFSRISDSAACEGNLFMFGNTNTRSVFSHYIKLTLLVVRLTHAPCSSFLTQRMMEESWSETNLGLIPASERRGKLISITQDEFMPGLLHCTLPMKGMGA